MADGHIFSTNTNFLMVSTSAREPKHRVWPHSPVARVRSLVLHSFGGLPSQRFEQDGRTSLEISKHSSCTYQGEGEEREGGGEGGRGRGRGGKSHIASFQATCACCRNSTTRGNGYLHVSS